MLDEKSNKTCRRQTTKPDDMSVILRIHMATYKVIQDVEAEDKILGPLTLRQFVYAGICVIMLYSCYFVATHNLGFMIVVFLPIAIVFGFFAFPWGRDQPTEIWALAKIRFMLKPRKRIWDQSGVKEMVTITAPKQMEGPMVSHLSQTEVKSRLHALAETIDSRGWAIKNANINAYAATPLILQQPSTDRLLEVSSAQQQPLANLDVQASDDMLDEKANPRAQRMDSMISASTKAHRQKLLDEIKNTSDAPAPGQPQQPRADYWFLNQPARPVSAPSGTVTFNTQVVTPGTADDTAVTGTAAASPTADEEALMNELAARKDQGPNASYYGHLRTIQPISVQREQAAKKAAEAARIKATQPPPPSQPPVPATPPPPPVTPAQQAAILQLASNDDLNVATIAREAKRAEPGDEVVIKLH